MKGRLFQLTGVAVTVSALSLLMATVSGQAPSGQGSGASAQQSGPAPKTSWGEPDLQGIWTSEYQVPLQRPAKYKDKASFTEQEVAALDKERTAKPTFGEKRAERGTEK